MMISKIARILVSCGGVGYISPGSGTWGSVVAAIATYGCMQVWGAAGIVFSIILSCAVGMLAIPYALQGSSHKDPSWIVIDEWAGMAIALAGCVDHWVYITGAFVFFRFFDIVKLGIVGRLERVSGAWGIMLDDVAAGLMSCVAMRCMWYLLKTIRLV